MTASDSDESYPWVTEKNNIEFRRQKLWCFNQNPALALLIRTTKTRFKVKTLILKKQKQKNILNVYN